MTQGYSGTPLGRKLGLKPEMRVAWLGMPDDIRTLLSDEVPGLHHVNPADTPDLIHVFTSRRKELDAVLTAARTQMAQNGMVWASWPKKSSKVATDVTEDVIRDVCLPMGLVDVKVCAVDATWSGLKLVIRKELRA